MISPNWTEKTLIDNGKPSLIKFHAGGNYFKYFSLKEGTKGLLLSDSKKYEHLTSEAI